MLTFGRNENLITLRCVSDAQSQFPVQNANFFLRTGTSREPFTQGQQTNNVIVFTLTPEIEGNFSCRNPNTPNEFSEELLLAGEE